MTGQTRCCQLILMGIGHSHLFVLEQLKLNASFSRAVEVVAFSPDERLSYSGMIPGWLSRQYELSDCQISLSHQIALLQQQGINIHWVQRSVVHVDAVKKVVMDDQGETYSFDVLSIDVGSHTRDLNSPTLSPASSCIEVEDSVCKTIAVKPLHQFCEFIRRMDVLLNNHSVPDKFLPHNEQKLSNAPPNTKAIGVIGSGAAAIELVSALRCRYPDLSLALLVKGAVLQNFPDSVSRRAIKRLQRLKINLLDSLSSSDEIAAQIGHVAESIAWVNATGATSPAGIQFSGLDQDGAGFLLVNSTHQCRGYERIFAAGDICSRPNSPLQRSGVHAVRVGPVLAENISLTVAAVVKEQRNHQLNKKNGHHFDRMVACKPHTIYLKSFFPRTNNLYLLAIGHRWAILNWGTLTLSGRWLWYLKDFIDRSFIKRFR